MRYLEMPCGTWRQRQSLKELRVEFLNVDPPWQTSIGLLPSFSLVNVATFNSKARSTDGLVVEISWHGRAIDGIGTQRQVAGLH